MDSSAFSQMDFGGLWWLFIFAIIGMMATATGIGCIIAYLVHHIRWI